MKFILALSLMALVGSFGLADDSAKGLHGDVLSIEPLVIRNLEDGSVRTVTINSKIFTVFDGSISLDDKGMGCGCHAKSVGMLEKPAIIKADVNGKKYTLTIPAHRSVLFQYGNTYQIDIKDSKSGNIGADEETSSINQNSIFDQYEETRALSTFFINRMGREVAGQDYKKARATYSKVVAHELYSSDIQRLDHVFKSIPESERPLNTYTNDVRWEMETMIKTFGGVNFDQMTVAEYVAFVDAWASVPFSHPYIPKQPGGNDETYLFRFFNQVGIPEETQVNLYIKTIKVRIAALIKLAKTGVDRRHADTFEDDYNTDAAVKELVYGNNERGHQAIRDLKKYLGAQDQQVQSFLKGMWFTFELERFK